MGGIGSSTAKTAKDLAKQVAKTMAREPVEMARVAKEVTFATEATPSATDQTQSQGGKDEVSPVEKQEIEQKSKRLMQALEQELAEIRQEKKNEEEEEKQMELIKAQKKQELNKSDEIPQGTSRPSRKFGEAVKTQIQRLRRSAEAKPPPSG